MPLKEDTELQLLLSLSNTPLQLDITFIMVSSHESKNTAQSHINKFYEPFCEIKKRRFDGLIITGAPVEQMEFEEVDYWEELVEIMDSVSYTHLIGKAEHDRYQKYGQDNADAGHPALPAVKPGRNGNKVKIMLHLYSLPNP